SRGSASWQSGSMVYTRTCGQTFFCLGWGEPRRLSAVRQRQVRGPCGYEASKAPAGECLCPSDAKLSWASLTAQGFRSDDGDAERLPWSCFLQL
ncbi:unnamed protein product, partial [Polarella glacialis]